jgi:O-antigen ligase
MQLGLRLGRDVRQARGVLWAIALGAGLSGVLGLGEALRWAPLDPVLALFKVAPTRVGGDVRASASFQYATIAAMYFEMVAPLAIVLAATARSRLGLLLGAGIAVVCTANVVLSLTRAGMLTLALVYAALVAIGYASGGLRRVLLPALAGAGVLVGGAILLFVHDPVFDLRLQTESDADWYGAAYSAPATLQLQADQTSTVDLDVRNEGRITWTTSGTHPFALGYRWLTADGTGVLDVAPAEVSLAHDVEPGDTIHVQADLAVPDLPAGTYRLDWGMLQRDVLQFYERGWADAETEVSIAPAVTTATGGTGGTLPGVSPRDDGEAPWVVGRLDLWGAAVRLIATHPLLGVGPDNFRHYYGAVLGLEAWDERVEANNVYLEILADLGVLGLAAFAWVVAGPLVATGRGVLAREARGLRAYLALGVGLSLVAFLVHGLLDAFLAFNPTAWLFWLLLGFAAALGPASVRRSDPDQKPQVSGR